MDQVRDGDMLTQAELAAHIDASMSEAELFEQVRQLLDLGSWVWYHTYSSQRSNAGFPDIVAVRRERLIFIELKTAKGKLSQAQERWRDALFQTQAWKMWPPDRAVCPEVYLWRPSDWEQIVEVLA